MCLNVGVVMPLRSDIPLKTIDDKTAARRSSGGGAGGAGPIDDDIPF